MATRSQAIAWMCTGSNVNCVFNRQGDLKGEFSVIQVGLVNITCSSYLPRPSTSAWCSLGEVVLLFDFAFYFHATTVISGI